MPVILLLAAMAILGCVVLAALGMAGEMAAFPSDSAPLRLEAVTAADVALLRPPQALWGYNVPATEEALGVIARAVAARDTEIATLRRELADAQAHWSARAPAPREHDEVPAWPRRPVPVPAPTPPPRAVLAPTPPPRAVLASTPPPRAVLASTPPPRPVLASTPPPRPVLASTPPPRPGRGPVNEVAVPRPGAVPGPDGVARCPWALGSADYLAYHDDEWGRPVRDDAGLFERLSLEAFQSGLSWLTILRKRENFRAAFAGFDPAAVAAFGPADEARLLADPGIVRNRAKITAVIGNARAALEVPGGLAGLVWRYAGPPARRPSRWRTCRPGPQPRRPAHVSCRGLASPSSAR